MKRFLSAILFFMLSVSISNAGEISVEVVAVATSVENLIPIGVAEKFPANTVKLYCYSKIIGGAGQNIKHLWYLNEKRIGETTLAIKSNSYRTFSVGVIRPGMKGNGRCNVTTEDGKVLKSAEFIIE